MAMAGVRVMQFTHVTRALEIARTFILISSPFHGLLVSPRVLPLVHLSLRSEMRVGLMDIIAGQNFTPMESGGPLTSARATNVLPCLPITSVIIRPIALNSVAVVTSLSNLDPFPGQSTSSPTQC